MHWRGDILMAALVVTAACNRPAEQPRTLFQVPVVDSAAPGPQLAPESGAGHTSPAVRQAASGAPIAGRPDALRVNGELIEAQEIQRRARPELAALAQRVGPSDYRRELIRLMQNYIVYEVHETLLFQSASVAVSDKAVLEAVDRLVDQEIKDRINREFEGRQSRMEDHLRAQGQTLGQVRAEIRREVLITHHLQETILPRIANPTRQELWDFYQEHLDDFTTQESRELWLIDIPYAGDPAAARAAADQAASRLAAGEPFEEVARTLSKGIHAQRGGAWGEITTQMQGRYAQVSQTLFGLPEGAASDVIDTGDAYFIVKAGRVQPAQRRPFTEVQPELAERYRAARFASLRQQLLEKLLSQAVIEPDEGPFLQALVEAAPSHAEMLAQPSSPP